MAGASYAELLDILKARLVIEVELLRDSIRQGDDEWQKRTLLSHRNLSRAPELRRGAEAFVKVKHDGRELVFETEILDDVVEARLAEASTTSSRCDWERTPTQKGDLGSSYSIIAVPDGAWAWKQVASRVPDSVDATVGGHPARVTSTGDVYLSDGVNLLHLTGQRLAGVSVVDTSLGVLSVLSAGSGHTRG